MTVKSLVKMSLTDWDGKVSAVVFMSGCNYRCPYCHNWQLVEDPDSVDDVDWNDVLDYLESASGWLDGVVVTGGEPTCDPVLPSLLEDIKDKGLPIKLDTNGSVPDVIESLIERGLVDYIAMDVKNSYKKYDETAGARVNTDDIARSIELVRSLSDHEFRTTVVPGLVEPEDVATICTYIKGTKNFILQRFHPENVLNKEYSEVSPPSDEEMDALVELCPGDIPTEWRG